MARECGSDEALHQEVESLLASYDDDFLQSNVSGQIFSLLRGELLPGTFIAQRYRIVAKLGGGGMGEVYQAYDFKLNREIALKALAQKFSQAQERVEKFKQEARLASGLNHKNILIFYDLVEDGDATFISTEVIAGNTLREKLQAGALDLKEAVRITTEIASALTAAHQKNIVHCDIKPENIIIKPSGEVKLLDFGIAQLIARESPLPLAANQGGEASGWGTIGYMSPEQLRSQEIDGRSDIWSLGVCLYEMLEGRQPFTGQTKIDTAAAILNREPPLLEPHLPTRLREIVTKALQKEREDRYQTMGEFQSALAQVAATSESDMDSFPQWIKTAGCGSSLFLLGCCCLSLGLAVACYVLNQNDLKEFSKNARIIGCLSHLIIIGLALIYLWVKPGLQKFRPIECDLEGGHLKTSITDATGYVNKSDWEQARKLAELALANYKTAFKGLLGAWLFLYLAYLYYIYQPKDDFIISCVGLANNLNTLFTLACFRVLNEPITTENKTRQNKALEITPTVSGRSTFWIIGFVLAFGSFVVELRLAQSLFAQAQTIHYGAKLIIGLSGGVTLALLVARFQSKFLKSPTWLTMILFLYTVIQGLFIFYGAQGAQAGPAQSSDNGEIWAVVIIEAALFCKSLLLLYTVWLFHSGLLMFYLVRVRRAVKQVESEWHSFREVLPKGS